MDNTLYVGLSRQMTLRRELDIVANNMANADTTGFKVESLMTGAEPGNRARTAQAPGPVKFVLDRGLARDFGQGSLNETGNAFDFAIEGDGFFRVQTAEGERYTRNGQFTVDDQGQLTTQAGEVVQGDGGPIVVDFKKGPVAVGDDGSVSQGQEIIGKLAVWRFDDRASLEKAGDNLFRNISNLQPQAAPDAKVRQGMLEASNVKPILEMTRLIEISRAYESITRMMESTNELTRRSVERLGRVS
ncbi:MAG: flagellar basal-body rod protein FlgF [Caulobacteraceae bacterium]|nr:flagellar basal-body rod protein FlgF [Caulobacteraceae bacterium]